MLVHFPTSLFSVAFIFDVSGLFFHIPELHLSSFYVLAVGLAGGLLAGVFGIIDLLKMVSKPDLFSIAGKHAILQFVVMTIFGVIGGLKYGSYPQMQSPAGWQLGLMGLGVVIMLIGNYLGGELIFTHKVGVNEDLD